MIDKTIQKLFVLVILSAISFVIFTTLIFWLFPLYDYSGDISIWMDANQREIILFFLSFAIVNVARIYRKYLVPRLIVRAVLIADASVVLYLLLRIVGIDSIGIGVVAIVCLLLGILLFHKKHFGHVIGGLLLIVGIATFLVWKIPTYPHTVSLNTIIAQQPQLLVAKGTAGGKVIITDTKQNQQTIFLGSSSQHRIFPRAQRVFWQTDNTTQENLELILIDGTRVSITPNSIVAIRNTKDGYMTGDVIFEQGTGKIITYSQQSQIGTNEYQEILHETIQQILGREYSETEYLETIIRRKYQIGTLFFPEYFGPRAHNFLLYRFLMGKSTYKEKIPFDPSPLPVSALENAAIQQTGTSLSGPGSAPTSFRARFGTQGSKFRYLQDIFGLFSRFAK